MVGRLFVLILAVGVGAAIGAFAGARLASDEPPAGYLLENTAESLAERLTLGEAGELDPKQVAQVVESLIHIVDEEISERRVLEEQLEQLRSEMVVLQQILGTVESEFSADAEIDVPEQAFAQADQTVDGRLAAAGFTPPQVDTLRRREAEAAMRYIELDDRARREGWLNSPRYYEEVNNVTSAPDTIRMELGDDAYDRYLFAGGNPNRIAVDTTIETSPAQQAGLRPGDVIARYGGERIFSAEQLVKLRSAGERGQPVTVEIIRDGQLLQISMPRGPMGVQTRPEMVDPNAAPGG